MRTGLARRSAIAAARAPTRRSPAPGAWSAPMGVPSKCGTRLRTSRGAWSTHIAPGRAMASVVPLDARDVLAPIAAALSRGLLREAEVFLAGVALRILERVEAGTLDAADAN